MLLLIYCLLFVLIVMPSFVVQDLLPPVDSAAVFSKAVILLLIYCLLFVLIVMPSFAVQDLLPPVDSAAVFSKAVMLLLIHLSLFFLFLCLLLLCRTKCHQWIHLMSFLRRLLCCC